MRCCNRFSGFTLLKVLIALAVMGVALAALSGEIVQMVNTATKMQNQTYTSWIGHNKVTEIRQPVAPIGCPNAQAPPFTFTVE